MSTGPLVKLIFPYKSKHSKRFSPPWVVSLTSYRCSYDLLVCRTWLERPKKGPCQTWKCLARQIWRFFGAIRGIFDTTALIWTVKVPYQKRKWPCWISSSMIRTFQTGNGSYTTWMCLQHVIKYQNHSDTSHFQMWLMPFPIYFIAIFSLSRTRVISHIILLCVFSIAIARFLRYLSDLRLSKIFLNPLWPFSFHSSPSVRLGTFQTGCGVWADMVFYSSRSYNRPHLLGRRNKNVK